MAMLMVPPAPPAPVDPVDLAIRRAAEERGLVPVRDFPAREIPLNPNEGLPLGEEFVPYSRHIPDDWESIKPVPGGRIITREREDLYGLSPKQLRELEKERGIVPGNISPEQFEEMKKSRDKVGLSESEQPVLASMLPGGQRGQRPDRPLAEGGGGGYAPSRKVSPEAQRYLDKTVRETEEFISKNNLPSISREQFINNLRLREGQMARDLREFNKSNPGEAYGGRQTLREIRELLRAFGE